MKLIYKTLSILALLQSSILIILILYRYNIDGEVHIRLVEFEPILMIIFISPILILSTWSFIIKTNYDENEKLEMENEMLIKKIKKAELEQKLAETKKKNE